MSVFGRNIRKLREYMDWSIEKMSLETGIGVGMVSNYELGKSQPNLIVLTKFSEIFNMTIDELIKLEEFEIIEKYESRKNNSNNSNNHNIISNNKTRNKGDIIQSQGGKHAYQRQNDNTNSSEVVIESLKKENEFLKTQLKFTQELLEKAMSK